MGWGWDRQTDRQTDRYIDKKIDRQIGQDRIGQDRQDRFSG